MRISCPAAYTSYPSGCRGKLGKLATIRFLALKTGGTPSFLGLLAHDPIHWLTEQQRATGV